MRRTKRPPRPGQRSQRKPSMTLNLVRLSVQREGFHRRDVVEGEQHALLQRAMPMQRPRRQREDVLLLPLEALSTDLGPAAALGDLVDHAAGVTMCLRLLAFRE